MSWGVLVATVAAGAAGAVARAWVSWAIGRAWPGSGHGTLVVNLLGALVAGIVAAADGSGTATRVVGVGFLGGFTTFSTWMTELHAAWLTGRRVAAVTGALGVLLAGVAMAALGNLVHAAWVFRTIS